MDYPVALAYLESLPYREVKPGLERIAHLLEKLGNPHLELRTIHIGGTNGKGSVVSMLASALREAGYCIGTYTSPHLLHWRERIQIDGECISDSELAERIAQLQPIIEGMADRPTVFETLTALAFQHFQEKAVDLAIIEVGLGGRFDATNVLHPLLAVITTVEWDHLDLLGSDMESLAWEKAGIAKRGVPLVVGKAEPGARQIITRECAEQGAELLWANTGIRRIGFTWEEQEFQADGWGQIKLGLLGAYQRENLVVTLKTISVLRRFLKLSDEAVKEGLRLARWPGRFQVVNRRPCVIIDGAHNPSGAQALLKGLRNYWERYLRGGRRLLIFGVLRDKQIEGMAEALFPWFDELILTKPDYYRAVQPEPLAELASEFDKPARAIIPAGEAYRQAREGLSREDLLCVTGSLYLVGEVLGYES